MGACFMHGNSEKMMNTNTNQSSAVSGCGSDPVDYCVFKMGDDEYGIESSKVQILYTDQKIIPIADAPAFIKGSINLNGVEVLVVDLRVLLNLDGAGELGGNQIMILRIADKMVGVLIDHMPSTVAATAQQVRPLHQILQH